MKDIIAMKGADVLPASKRLIKFGDNVSSLNPLQVTLNCNDQFIVGYEDSYVKNEPIMTPDEFYSELQKIQLKSGNDYEMSHVRMDDLMCDLLESLGYKDGIEFFKKSDRWYS